MQLILNTDTNIGVQKKMSTIQQESLEEKFIIKGLIEKLGSNIEHISNGKDNCANNEDITEICNENGNSKDNENIAIENDDGSEIYFCTDEEENANNAGKKETDEAEHKQPVENIETSKLVKQNMREENGEIDFNMSKEIFKGGSTESERIKLISENKEDDTKNKDNIEQQMDKEPTVDNGHSEIKSEESAAGRVEKFCLEEKVTECLEPIQLKEEAAKNNTVVEKVIEFVEKNKDSGEEKTEIEKSHIDEEVIASHIESCHEIAKETKNSASSNENINEICNTESKSEDPGDTNSEKSTYMKENCNSTNKEIQQEEKLNKDQEHNVNMHMEIDDEIVVLSDKQDKKGNQILQDNIDVHVPAACDNKEIIINCNKGEVIDIIDDSKEEDSNIVLEEKIPQDVEKQNKTDNCIGNDSNIESKETKLPEEVNDNLIPETQKIAEEPSNSKRNVEENKKFTHISKLSNTLDILSDDEDPPNNESQKDIQSVITVASIDKQCINIEDDDDIMLIDEEPSTTNPETKTENEIAPLEEAEKNDKGQEEHNIEAKEEHDAIKTSHDIKELEDITNEDLTNSDESKQEKIESEESESQLKPLLPVNFLKTFKKIIPDMTRDELEEFCILKIVESVVDRSNLTEIRLQLKTMVQNLDEYKKKVLMVTKQNRDLQVVLKSVQEEQKKRSDTPITPLKITRSVGMQVLMNDKTGVRRKPVPGTNPIQNPVSNSPHTRLGKSQSNQVLKTKANSNTSASIPVPRLVPASNNSNLNNIKIQPATATSPGKSPLVTSVTSGPPSSQPSTPKPEKRPHSRIQQNNSVTVDLTDDEPPAKVIQRNVNPPVRLVNPQNLLTPHRPPFGPNINSPRKVYIPISGSQNQSIRPGQTIMLKTIAPQGPRQRCPTPNVSKPNQTPNTLRMQRPGASRHPAPLPDSMKQYQPPNWKALPPAPELKLSKVENGIVISWKIDGYQEENHEEIASYQLYAYQETISPPSTALWKKIGDVKALPLPMACTLTQFMAGYKYYFAVRAVDVRSRLGPFSLPGSILLLNKM